MKNGCSTVQLTQGAIGQSPDNKAKSKDSEYQRLLNSVGDHEIGGNLRESWSNDGRRSRCDERNEGDESRCNPFS